jgi:antitoxin component YwqK of YwqJK toxin-antitoxin module
MTDFNQLTEIEVDENGTITKYKLDGNGNRFLGIACRNYSLPWGEEEEQIPFVNGLQHGVVKSYNKNGDLLSERSSLNYVSEGWSKTWKDNQLESYSIFSNGAEALKMNYREGRISSISCDKVRASNDQLTIYFQSNGLVGSLQNNDSLSGYGIKAHYYDTGHIRSFENFKGTSLFNNPPDGLSENYFANGLLCSRSFFTNGLKEGNWVRYYENGKKQWEGSYKKDSEDGVHLWYNKNGKKDRREEYREGVRIGHWFNLTHFGAFSDSGPFSYTKNEAFYGDDYSTHSSFRGDWLWETSTYRGDKLVSTKRRPTIVNIIAVLPSFFIVLVLPGLIIALLRYLLTGEFFSD